MTKPVILNPTSQKTSKRQTTVSCSRKILKICRRIKIFLQILEKEVFFAKFRTIILNIAEIHKILVKKLTSDVLTFKIAPKNWKIITVSSIEHKYGPCREMKSSHLHFLKLSSMNRPSMSLGITCFDKSLLEISFQI